MGIDYQCAICESTNYGYQQLKVSMRDEGHMLSFRHDHKCGGVQINVYFKTGSVKVCLDRPILGESQLFRRNLILEDLKDSAKSKAFLRKVFFEEKCSI